MGRSTKLANRSCWRRGHNYWFLKNHLEIWIIWTLARPRCRNNCADLVGQGSWRYSSLCFLCCPYRASVPSKGSSSSTLYTLGWSFTSSSERSCGITVHWSIHRCAVSVRPLESIHSESISLPYSKKGIETQFYVINKGSYTISKRCTIHDTFNSEGDVNETALDEERHDRYFSYKTYEWGPNEEGSSFQSWPHEQAHIEHLQNARSSASCKETRFKVL